MSDLSYVWWLGQRRAVRVISRTELWGRDVVDVVDPATSSVTRLSADEVGPLSDRRWDPDEVVWRAAACRTVAAAASGAPVASEVELLPHQATILARALALDPVRLGLCDEVGLGKTITAAAIFTELKARKRARRVLIVAPKSVQLQWVAEFGDRFGEEFVRVGPEGMPVDAGVDPWRAFPQIICSLDAVKPIRARAGWTAEQVSEYNRRRIVAIVAAGWDLVIFDEAHHVAGSSDEVARHRLARELTASVPNVLLLSATPHSGKSDGFRRFVGLLDEDFFAGAPLTRGRVNELVVRTEKRTALDNARRPLFMPRTTSIEVVRYGDRVVERELYDAVTEYVREGYGRAVREKRPAVGFLVLLMQRLVSSSTAALLAALEKRAAVLDVLPEQLELGMPTTEWEELTGEEQLERLLELRGHGWASERVEVHTLLQMARRAASDGLDAKVVHLLDLLRRLETAESDPDVKVIIFTEFLPTQQMLLDALASAGITAIPINGSLSLAERAVAQRGFREHARILVSTDAGGEGINLQFAHVVINWDLPWTPTKIEQRIGRVDRIGQTAPVQAFNLVRENSVDLRVLEVLERKLATILAELGADKRDDVLESLSGRSEQLYVDAIMEPDSLDRSVEELSAATRDEVLTQATTLDLISPQEIEAAVSTYTDVRDTLNRAADARRRFAQAPGGRAIDALQGLPEVVPGEPVPVLRGIGVVGWWGCFEVADPEARRVCFALFSPDGGGLVRPDLAERCWTTLTVAADTETGPAPDDIRFEELIQLGRDHGYRAWGELASTGVPSLVPRLVVRVAS